MENRNEIRKAHEIVDKIDSIYEREALRKLLPPRPKVTFGETIQALRGMASEDDVHLWTIIGQLERFEKSYSAPSVVEDEELTFKDAPEGSLAAADGSDMTWIKGLDAWRMQGTSMEFDVERAEGSNFKILRWGWGVD